MLTVKFTFRGEDSIFIAPGYSLRVEPTKDFSLPMDLLEALAQERLQKVRKENRRHRRKITLCTAVLVEDNEELFVRHGAELLTVKHGESVTQPAVLTLCDHCGWLDNPTSNSMPQFYCRDPYCQEVKRRSENSF